MAHDTRLDLAQGLHAGRLDLPQQQAPGGGRIIDKSEVGTSNGYLLDTHPGNSLRLITERGVLSYDAKLKPDVWVHVAATVTPRGTWLCISTAGRSRRSRTMPPGLAQIDVRVDRIRKFYQQLVAAGLADSYEAAHARLAVEYLATTCQRLEDAVRGQAPATARPIAVRRRQVLLQHHGKLV